MNKSQALILAPALNFHGFNPLEGYRGAASIQLQLKPAFDVCKEIGLAPSCFSLQIQHPEDLDLIERPAVCIAGKMSTTSESQSQSQAIGQLAVLARLKSRGIPLICTYSNHVKHTNKANKELHLDFLKLADHVVFPCNAIKNKCLEWVPEIKDYSVILDPWQVSSAPFRKRKTKEIDALWFGHRSNLCFLVSLLQDLKKSAEIKNKKINLTILTNEWGLNRYSEILEKIHDENVLNIKKVKWNDDEQPMQLEQELRNSAFCLLPSNPENSNKAYASHNRLVDSVRAGCIAIASPLESYLELSKIAIVGSDIIKLLHLADEQYERLTIKYSNNREEALSKFSPENNRLSWKRCISKTLST